MASDSFDSDLAWWPLMISQLRKSVKLLAGNIELQTGSVMILFLLHLCVSSGVFMHVGDKLFSV